MGELVPHLTSVTRDAAIADCLAWLKQNPEQCRCFSCGSLAHWRSVVQTISGGWLCMECFTTADAIGSYNDAVAAIGARVKAGQPVPDFFLSDKT